MGDFDRAARYAAKLDPVGFLAWAAPGMLGRLWFSGWLDTRSLPFPGEPDRTSDTTARLDPLPGGGGVGVDADDRVWALVGEFQAEPSADMPRRFAEYLVRVLADARPPDVEPRRFAAAALLLNLTGPERDETLDLRPPGGEGSGLVFRPIVRTLSAMPAEAHLDDIAAGRLGRCILPWVPLMHGADRPDIIRRWREIAESEADPRRRTAYAVLARTFAQLARRLGAWDAGLQGFNMQTAEAFNEIRAEGRVEGRVDAMRESISRLWRRRFGSELPADLKALLEADADYGRLTARFDAAVSADSPESFRVAVTSAASPATQG
jgi:hypothetical protein